MKRLIFLTFLVLLFIFNTNVSAQEFKFGLVGGFNITKARLTNLPEDGRHIEEYSPMVSYNFNGYIGYKSGGLIGISVEPGFIQKGGGHKFYLDNGEENVRIQLNYLQLPVLVDFYVGKNLSLFVGPEFSYLLNAGTNDDLVDISVFYDKDFELSGVVGVSYNVHKNFDIGSRYSRGFSYTSKITFSDEAGNIVGDSKEYNQYFQFFVRFKI
ncbi:PorT family protein [Labilibacter sediminis]|nr:PorT family protein [Labilibacter sediminis]